VTRRGVARRISAGLLRAFVVVALIVLGYRHANEYDNDNDNDNQQNRYLNFCLGAQAP
jgi:hypothetical protein